MDKMITTVWSRQFVFHLLVHGEVEGVRRPSPIQNNIDTTHCVHVTLMADDAIEGVNDTAVVSFRVGHKTLHACLKRNTDIDETLCFNMVGRFLQNAKPHIKLALPHNVACSCVVMPVSPIKKYILDIQ